MGRRINARIDEDLAQKVDHLASVTNQKVTEVVKAALELYYRSVVEEVHAADLLRASGFIGCGSASEGLSERYKEGLSESMGAKV